MKTPAVVVLTFVVTLVVSLGASYLVFKPSNDAGNEGAADVPPNEIKDTAERHVLIPTAQAAPAETEIVPSAEGAAPEQRPLSRMQVEVQEAWDNHLRAVVLSTLKDPESAKFRCVSIPVVRDKKAVLASIEVNAKNSYGGYTGFQCHEYIDVVGLVRSQESTCMCSIEASGPFRVANP